MDNYTLVLEQQIQDLMEDVEKGVQPVKKKSIARRKEDLPKIEAPKIELNEDYLTELETLLEYKRPVVEEVVQEIVPLKEEVVVQEKKPEVIKEQHTPKSTVELTESLIAVQTKIERSREKDEIVLTNEEQTDLKLHNLQRQINEVSSSLRGLRESTLVSGIGQGGDGQTPGSGEVNINRMDDVAVTGLTNGQVLTWDASLQKYVNTSVAGVGGDVSQILAGDGIDVSGDGTGIVTISLAANTAQLNLTNPVDTGFRYSNEVVPAAQLTNQEDANGYFAQAIDDLDGRVTSIENTGSGATQDQIDDINELIADLTARLEAFENGTNLQSTAPITTDTTNSVTTTGFSMTDLNAPPP